MTSHAATFDTPAHRSTALHISLWLAQVALALLFGIAGAMKSTLPLPQLALTIAWTADIPAWLVRTIGISELAGAVGLLLPALTRIKPWLTPLAASLLALVMMLAVVFHLARGEAALTLGPVVFGALAAFIAWGRTRKAPIAPRG